MQHELQHLILVVPVPCPPATNWQNSIKKSEINYIVNSTIIWVYNLFYRTVSIVAQNSIGNALIFCCTIITNIICMCMCMYIYIYIYICMNTYINSRERDDTCENRDPSAAYVHRPSSREAPWANDAETVDSGSPAIYMCMYIKISKKIRAFPIEFWATIETVL